MGGPSMSLKNTPSQGRCLNGVDSWERRGRARRMADLQASEQIRLQAIESDSGWVEEATRDPFVWVTEHTKTYNEHWKTEGRPSSSEHFPKLEYFRVLFNVFDLEEITWIEKSRDMMVSWAC